MGTKRTKLWRKKQEFRIFKARMIYYAAGEEYHRYADGTYHKPLHWFELAKEHWAQVYRTTGTPCSCWICQGVKYNRLDYKRDTKRIIREETD